MKPWNRQAGFVFVVAAWIALAWIGWKVYSPPAPRRADSPDNEFSAERARVILKELVGRGIPHPTGSQENTLVRERILNDLRSVGYDPQVQETHTIPGRSALVKRTVVRNIVARRRGRQPGPAIMLAAHYDSVPRGPGASDDGVAVAAILEIARMLQALPPTRNDVIFLITDGEEEGLVGAHGFVREHPWAKDVKVVINLEARGTSGPSLMFQTSDDDKWLISLLARHMSRPTTSSLYAEIYKRLPNDTDFTVFKKFGMEGYNFAFVRYERNYHTKNDNFADADPGSLQHHGQNAWQLVTALADRDLSQRSPGRAIYCDVLALFVVWWPASINFGLAVGILAVTLAAGVISRRRGLFSRFKWRILLSVAAPLLAGALAVWWMGLRGDFVDDPLRPIAAFWVFALLAVFAVARYTPLGNIEMWSAWTGVWVYWDIVGLVAAWFVPGASYLFLLPGAITAIAGLVAACWPPRGSSRVFLGVCCLGPVAVGVLWLPIQVLFADGVSLTMTPVYPLCAALTTVTALPLLARGITPLPASLSIQLA